MHLSWAIYTCAESTNPLVTQLEAIAGDRDQAIKQCFIVEAATTARQEFILLMIF